MHVGLAGEVYDREEQVADFIREPILRRVLHACQFVFHFCQFFAYLRHRSHHVGPVESHPCSAFLKAIGHQQIGEGGREAVEGAALQLPFARLERGPLFGRSQVEKLRMAPLHLGDEVVGDLARSELAGLLAEDKLPGEMEHQVGHLVANRRGVAGGEGRVEFMHFLDQVGSQRLARLDAVPAAAGTQVGYHRYRPPKW